MIQRRVSIMCSFDKSTGFAAWISIVVPESGLYINKIKNANANNKCWYAYQDGNP